MRGIVAAQTRQPTRPSHPLQPSSNPPWRTHSSVSVFSGQAFGGATPEDSEQSGGFQSSREGTFATLPDEVSVSPKASRPGRWATNVEELDTVAHFDHLLHTVTSDLNAKLLSLQASWAHIKGSIFEPQTPVPGRMPQLDDASSHLSLLSLLPESAARGPTTPRIASHGVREFASRDAELQAGPVGSGSLLPNINNFPPRPVTGSSKTLRQLRTLKQKTISQLFTLRPEWNQLHEESINDYELRFRIHFGFADSTGDDTAEVNPQLENATTKWLADKEQAELPRYMLHPSGNFRILWNMICLLLIMYDIIFVPLMVFEVPYHWFIDALEWVCTVAWTLDMPLSCRTGYFYNGSYLEMNFKKVMRQYAKSWLLMDLIIIVMEWATRFSEALPGGAGLLRTSRVVRIIRVTRLFRVAKLQVLLDVIEDQITCNGVYLIFGLMKMSALLCVTVHIIACVWYAMGDSLGGGWVSYYGRTYDGQVVTMAPRDFLYWYFASSRWTLAQINGRTDMDERRNLTELLYTCSVAIAFAVIFMAVFISSITATMMELNTLAESRTRARRTVDLFLKKRRVSSELIGSIKQHVSFLEAKKDEERQHQEDVLSLLPDNLSGDLVYELRSPILCAHRWFSSLNREFPRAVRHICSHVVHQEWPIMQQVIFDRGDACTRLIFVDNGSMLYTLSSELSTTPRENSREEVKPDEADAEKGEEERVTQETETVQKVLIRGDWTSEAAIWVEWVNRGRLISGSRCSLLVVESSEFARQLREYRSAYAMAVLYARAFIRQLQVREAFSDIRSESAPSPYFFNLRSMSASRV